MKTFDQQKQQVNHQTNMAGSMETHGQIKVGDMSNNEAIAIGHNINLNNTSNVYYSQTNIRLTVTDDPRQRFALRSQKIIDISSAIQEILHRPIERLVIWWGWHPQDKHHLIEYLRQATGKKPLSNNSTFEALAQLYQYAESGGRQQLITLLEQTLPLGYDDSTLQSDREQLNSIISLPISPIIITPRWDAYLEKHILSQARDQFVTVDWTTDFYTLDSSQPQLIKLYGTIDEPDSLILTQEDIDNFSERYGRLEQHVRDLLNAKTWLLVHEIDDPILRKLYAHRSNNASLNQHLHYVLQTQSDEHRYDREFWQAQGLNFRTESMGQFVHALAQSLSKTEQEKEQTVTPEDDTRHSLYKYLDSFKGADQDVFYGRDRDISNVLEYIRDNSLTVLCGRSGVGKTSLLQAGIMPQLENEDFLCAYVSIGVNPLADLRNALLEIWNQDDPNELPNPSQPVHQYLLETINKRDKTIVICIDQFEHLQTYQHDVSRRSFENEFSLILEWADQRTNFLRIVIAIREDYLSIIESYRHQVNKPLRNTYRLANLDRPGAKDAIERPAQRYGISYEPAASELILSKLEGRLDDENKIFPPHLQIVCYQIVRRLPDGRKSISDDFINQLGGIDALINQHLNDSIAELDEKDQKAARKLLKELINPDEKTKISVTRERLIQSVRGFPDTNFHELINILVQNRLIRRIYEPEKDKHVRYELLHDQLAQYIYTIDWIEPGEIVARQLRKRIEDNITYWTQESETYAGLETKLLQDIYVQKDNPFLFPDLTHDAKKLLLQSVLSRLEEHTGSLNAYHHLGFWINRLSDEREREVYSDGSTGTTGAEDAVSLVYDTTRQSDNAMRIIAGLKHRPEELDADTQQGLIDRFNQLHHDVDATNRLKAAQMLMAFHGELSFHNRCSLHGTIFVLHTLPKLAQAAPRFLGLTLMSFFVIALLAGIFVFGTRYSCQNNLMEQETDLCQQFNPIATPEIITLSATPEIITITTTPEIIFVAPDDVEQLPHEMIEILAGDFFFNTDGVQSTVSLEAYTIDKYEVTNVQYKQCIDADVCRPPVNSIFDRDQYAEHPVTSVNLEEAQTYCDWIGGTLPTEQQWEKAARGTDGATYPWGEDAITAEKTNICDIQCTQSMRVEGLDDGYPETAPVGTFPNGASPFAVEDMVGNVWEWTDQGIARGGSWMNDKRLNKATARVGLDVTTRDSSVGFRCVRVDISESE